MPKKPNVIMFGPALDFQGGIASVVNTYLESGLGQKVDLFFVPTATTGSKIKKAVIFIRSFFVAIFMFMSRQKLIAHLHVSQDASFYRKLIFFVLAKGCGHRAIVHIHGSRFDEFMERNRLTKKLCRLMFDRADLIIALSVWWKERIRSFSRNQKVVVVYNPVSVAARNHVVHERVTILFMGRLGARKGVYDLLRCIQNYQNDFRKRNVRFVLAGDGEVGKARRFVSEYQLGDMVEVPGWVSGEKKEHYRELADIVVLASYQEQLPVSVLEGMAFGCPIVATKVAGIPEMVTDGENGCLFDPGDIHAMARALTMLLDDAGLRKRMGEKGRRIAEERFDAKNILAKLVSNYEALC